MNEHIKIEPNPEEAVLPSSDLLRKPAWLKVRPPGGENYVRIKSLLRNLNLHTVCEEASCPNIGECWKEGTATIMLMGDVCTRACKFCHVKSGNPKRILDKEEPQKVAEVLSQLKLNYVVLTSVDRDDLPDGGAEHFAQTVEEIKKRCPELIVEILIPDFQGEEESLKRIASCGAEVVAHNVETVRSLTRKVRDIRCNYDRSLQVLRRVKELNPSLYTKSSLMLGLGETQNEILETMDELLANHVAILTLGQYLRPSHWNLTVERYVSPETFQELEKKGLEKGFLCVPSGPLVRSSYRAGEKFLESRIRAAKSS